MPAELTPLKNAPPLSYRWLRVNGLSRLTPWHFIDDLDRIGVLRKEYWLEMDGTSDILPFAFRQDLDDIAGFVVVDGEVMDHVVDVHLTWAGRRDMYWLRTGEQPAPQDPRKFPSFQDWLTGTMLSQSLAWMSEADLDAMTSGDWPAVSKRKSPRPKSERGD